MSEQVRKCQKKAKENRVQPAIKRAKTAYRKCKGGKHSEELQGKQTRKGMTRVTDNQHKMRKAAQLECIPKQARKFEEKQRKNRVQPARKRAKTEGGQLGGGGEGVTVWGTVWVKRPGKA